MAYTRFSVTPTVDAVTNYAQWDVIGGALQFKGVRRGKLHQVILVTGTVAMANEDYIITLYDAQPSTIADNAPFNPTDGANSDAQKVIYTTYLTFANSGVPYETGGSYILRPTTEVALVSNEADGDIWGYVHIATNPADKFGNTTDFTVTLVVDVR